MPEAIKIRTAGLGLPLAFLMVACGKPPAHGTPNGLVVGATDEVWAVIEDSVRGAMQPTIFTVREELTFRVTQMDPTSPGWPDLSRFVQVLVVGEEDDPWVVRPLALAGIEEPLDPPQVIQVHNVWATNQQVTVVLLPNRGPPESVYQVLAELHDLLDRQYRDWARNKMFLTGRDTALADTLERTAGFSLVLPNVYEWRSRDSVYVFRNDNPDPSELIREVAVTWRAPPPEELTREYVTSWREELVEGYYDPGQMAALDDARATPITHRDHPAFELQAIWQNPPEYGWPAAGPFITRAVTCGGQDRVYLLDAWLYAPGKHKYEYMIQLETILDSFRCA